LKLRNSSLKFSEFIGYQCIITSFGAQSTLVSSEPLGLVFDPEAQTRRELVAERLNGEESVPDIPKAFGNRDCGFILFFKYII